MRVRITWAHINVDKRCAIEQLVVGGDSQFLSQESFSTVIRTHLSTTFLSENLHSVTPFKSIFKFLSNRKEVNM